MQQIDIIIIIAIAVFFSITLYIAYNASHSDNQTKGSEQP